jgi:hypothetical protein
MPTRTTRCVITVGLPESSWYVMTVPTAIFSG